MRRAPFGASVYSDMDLSKCALEKGYDENCSTDVSMIGKKEMRTSKRYSK